MRDHYDSAFTAPLVLGPQRSYAHANSGRLCTRGTNHQRSRTRTRTRHAPSRHPHRNVRMQRPPASQVELQPELPEGMRAPEGYKWDPDFPGTIKPGLSDDNYPLDEILQSGVYERMKYEEKDIDACEPIVHKTDEDLLEWLKKLGRLLPRDADVGDDAVAEALAVADDDDNDEDKAMLAYYSRQRDGAPTEGDFGGMSDSSLNEPGGL